MLYRLLKSLCICLVYSVTKASIASHPNVTTTQVLPAYLRVIRMSDASFRDVSTCSPNIPPPLSLSLSLSLFISYTN